MKLSDFDYNLPKELIAQEPPLERGVSRLLVVDRQKNSIEHKIFSDIVDYVNANDIVILNNTKVLPARLIGKKITGGKVDILIINQKEDGLYECLIKPTLKLHDKIIFSEGKLVGECIARNIIRFNADKSVIYEYGVMPLPPYIKRLPKKNDQVRYQTVFAKKDGAIAAPTAGLHFTDKLLEGLKDKTNLTYVTFHVGQGTFKPVKDEDINSHFMHYEEYEVDASVIEDIRAARAKGGRVICVGTTACRVIETIADKVISPSEKAMDLKDKTNLFILPGYNFKLTDCLLTNFHLPKTTLLMLVSAFMGQELLKKSYSLAIANNYRFYSYGDAMLIL